MFSYLLGFAGVQSSYAQEEKQEVTTDITHSDAPEETAEHGDSSSALQSPAAADRSYLEALTGSKKAEAEAPLIGREALRRRLKIDFNPIWGAVANTREAFERFQIELERCKEENEGGEKLKIALGVKKMKVWFGNTPAEVTALSKLKGFEFIESSFSSLLLDPSDESEPSSFGAAYFQEESERQQENYERLSKVDPSTIPVSLPEIEDFSGDDAQVGQIFSSLLETNEGVVVAVDGSSTSLFALEGQMAHLAHLGVTKIFLQNCCDNTMNQELDDFFTRKESSPFLNAFLKSGFGSLYPKVNCYDFAKAAVDAEIKLVGLDHLKTMTFPGQVVEPRHVMGANFSAFQTISLINRKEEGKYLVLLMGPERASYTDGIAGLSELCNAPSIYVQECKREDKPSLSKSVVNMGREEKGDKGEGNNHFIHAVLNIGNEYELV